MDAFALFASMAIGAIGTGFFIYGLKQHRWPQLAAGTLMGVYPWFVSNGWVMIGITVILILAVW
ncbi:MAG TPA: amino acid transport protein, partial [Planctomycetota bacterium]|nr:amino acid transport protein [Planctomycetota bacterium]